MFGFKKAHEPTKTLQYERYSVIWHSIMEAQIHLKKCAYEVITKNAVIGLYPEGANKVKAIENAEKSKLTLQTAIENFNVLRQELLDYYRYNSIHMRVCHSWHPFRWKTSHEYIEQAYKNYFKKD